MPDEQRWHTRGGMVHDYEGVELFWIFGDGVNHAADFSSLACDFDAVAECYTADDLRQLIFVLAVVSSFSPPP